MRMAWLGVPLALAVASLAGGLAREPLAGTYQLGGPLDDKGAPGAGRSHLYLSLTGQAATSLYESLAVEAHEDACTGHRMKARGPVACYEIEPGTEHFCSFSIDLERGKLDTGLDGCI